MSLIICYTVQTQVNIVASVFKQKKTTANVINYKILWLNAIANKWLSHVILKITALILDKTHVVMKHTSNKRIDSIIGYACFIMTCRIL